MGIILQNIGLPLVIIAILYALVFLFVFLDLWAGVRKAKARGEYRSSFGLRKTVDKLCRYFNMILVLTAIDAVQMLAIVLLNPTLSAELPVLPFFTFLGTIFVGIIEFKSIYEKNEVKEKAKIADAARIFAGILQHRDEHEEIENVIKLLQAERTKNDGKL